MEITNTQKLIWVKSRRAYGFDHLTINHITYNKVTICDGGWL